MPLFSVVQLEQDSGISRYTWRWWIRQGRVEAIRLGRRIRVSEESYRKFLEENRIRRPTEVNRA
jgi:excisionase family DNA binding protein